jgi:hypothetical protein
MHHFCVWRLMGYLAVIIPTAFLFSLCVSLLDECVFSASGTGIRRGGSSSGDLSHIAEMTALRGGKEMDDETV